MDSFWDFFWFVISFFFLMAYLVVMFQIITDLFRDRETSGIVKAVWVFFLIMLPLLTALIYLVARGQKMNERSHAADQAARQSADDYIRSVSSDATSPVAEIARAKSLLDSGAIQQEEYEHLKARALS